MDRHPKAHDTKSVPGQRRNAAEELSTKKTRTGRRISCGQKYAPFPEDADIAIYGRDARMSLISIQELANEFGIQVQAF